MAYKDWVIQNRGSEEYLVGDSIKVLSKNRTLVNRIVTSINKKGISTSKCRTVVTNLSECYVEVPHITLNWITLPQLTTNGVVKQFKSFIGIVPAFTIIEVSDGKYKLCPDFDYSFMEIDLKDSLLLGSLEECLTKANSLLYNS